MNLFHQLKRINTSRCIAVFFLFVNLLCTSPCFGQAMVFPGGLKYDDTVKAGSVLEKAIPIVNNGEDPLTVKISLVDYFFDAEGHNNFDPVGTWKRSNGTWIKFKTPQILQIPPKSTGNIEYTMHVPVDLKEEGTYWSMILVQPQEAPTIEEQPSGLGIRTVMQYGLQLVTDLGSNKSYDLNLLKYDVSEVDGQKKLNIDIENKGSFAVRPQVKVQLFNQDGKDCGEFKEGAANIYPFCSVRCRFDITSVPSGSYKALIILDGGGDGVTGKQIKVDIP